jgi:nucleoside-diphosphate-sugar epimerase
VTKDGMLHAAADISRAKKILGFEPRVALPEGLRKTAQWYRALALGRVK